MSSSDTGPRSGSKRPKSVEEMSEQLDELRLQMQKVASSVTDAAGKRSGTIRWQRSASRPASAFSTR
jgi:uncharacterized protein YoxC